MKYLSVDIDGVLNNYPQCWVDFINLETDKQFQSKEEATSILGSEEYKRLKKKYRSSSFKENLPVNKEAVAFLQEAAEKGYRIVVSTSRPIMNSEFEGLFDLTSRWLKKNDIPFERLIFKDKEGKFFQDFPQILFHIDDEMEYASLFSQKGFVTYLLSTSEKSITDQKIIPFSSFHDLSKISLTQ